MAGCAGRRQGGRGGGVAKNNPNILGVCGDACALTLSYEVTSWHIALLLARGAGKRRPPSLTAGTTTCSKADSINMEGMMQTAFFDRETNSIKYKGGV